MPMDFKKSMVIKILHPGWRKLEKYESYQEETNTSITRQPDRSPLCIFSLFPSSLGWMFVLMLNEEMAKLKKKKIQLKGADSLPVPMECPRSSSGGFWPPLGTPLLLQQREESFRGTAGSHPCGLMPRTLWLTPCQDGEPVGRQSFKGEGHVSTGFRPPCPTLTVFDYAK